MSSSEPGQTEDTRSRIVRAGMRLFRKHGYHDTGLADIMALATAPKGSLYHHFPQGKQAIGVAVIEALTLGMCAMLEGSRTRSTPGLIAEFGGKLALTMEHTEHELCSLFSGFVAERRSNPLLGIAVSQAYARLAEVLAKRLLADGHSAKAALELSQSVVMLLEGGATLAQAQQSTQPFKLAVKVAQHLCAKPSSGN